MKTKAIYLYLLLAFSIWSAPFCSRLFFLNNIHLTNVEQKLVEQEHRVKEKNVVNEIFNAYSNNERFKAFYLIFFNNIKVAIYNIAGGVFLGIGTFVNLVFNGFYTADTFATSGLSFHSILKYSLPHSIELVGIWLSGAIGFSMANMIINFMRGKELPSGNFKKHFWVVCLLTFFIILLAAYIEAYISVPANLIKSF